MDGEEERESLERETEKKKTLCNRREVVRETKVGSLGIFFLSSSSRHRPTVVRFKYP